MLNILVETRNWFEDEALLLLLCPILFFQCNPQGVAVGSRGPDPDDEKIMEKISFALRALRVTSGEL